MDWNRTEPKSVTAWVCIRENKIWFLSETKWTRAWTTAYSNVYSSDIHHVTPYGGIELMNGHFHFDHYFDWFQYILTVDNRCWVWLFQSFVIGFAGCKYPGKEKNLMKTVFFLHSNFNDILVEVSINFHVS